MSNEFKVGDNVRIELIYGADHKGKIGELVAIEAGPAPFRVCIPGSEFVWYCTEVAHVDTPQAERPIEVGDYVRWDGQMTGEHGEITGKMNRWAEGEAVSFHRDKWQVRITERSDSGFSSVCNFSPSVLRRIPRPAEAQAKVPIRGVFAHPDDVEAVFDHDAIYENGTAAKVTSDSREPRGMFRINWQNGDSKQFPVPKKSAVDPLDVKYDGVTLRNLLAADEDRRRTETRANAHAATLAFTRTQRTAVSAHWSAQLRARVAESAKRERNRVLVDVDEP